MNAERIYLDDQGGHQMQVLKEDVSPCILLNGAKAHALIVCEKHPRILALAADSGTHQTTYICLTRNRNGINVPHGTSVETRGKRL